MNTQRTNIKEITPIIFANRKFYTAESVSKVTGYTKNTLSVMASKLPDHKPHRDIAGISTPLYDEEAVKELIVRANKRLSAREKVEKVRAAKLPPKQAKVDNELADKVTHLEKMIADQGAQLSQLLDHLTKPQQTAAADSTKSPLKKAA